MFENDVVKIIDENGIEKEYNILFTFDNKKTNKSYVVYTDYSEDENGKVITFSSSYNVSNNRTILEPIETKEELDIINSMLTEISKKMNDKKEI